MPADNVLHANLSPEAHDGWVSVCGEGGVSLTALAEALGHAFAEHIRIGQPTDTLFGAQLDAFIRNARKVDAHRRRRGSTR